MVEEEGLAELKDFLGKVEKENQELSLLFNNQELERVRIENIKARMRILVWELQKETNNGEIKWTLRQELLSKIEEL